MNRVAAFETSWGANIKPGGFASFRLWAPAKKQISLLASNSSRQVPMRATGDGWFETETISERRRQEFEEWLEFQDPANQERIPDPNVRSTFALSALDWTGLQHSAHAKCLVFIQELLRLRAQKIVPRLHRMRGHAGDARMLSDRAFRVTWRLADGALLTAIANFDDKAIAAVGAARGVNAPVLYQSSPGLSDRIAQGELPGGAVLFCLREREQ